jgi:hydroxymethylbilane synthase
LGKDVKGGILKLTGCVTSLDGARHVEHTLEKEIKSLEEAEEVGAELARVLMTTGAREILDEITKDRAGRIGDNKSDAEVGIDSESTMHGAGKTQTSA